MLLCADIGGTKTKLALFARNAPCRPVRVARFENAEARDLGEILARFLGDAPPKLDAASLGVAGPVSGARVETTNLPWVIDGDALARHFHAPVYLLNDLEALAYGVSVLDDASCAVLNPGTPVDRGARAVIAAGTGLGEGGLLWSGGRPLAIPSEGGHADFAPRTEREIALLRHLQTVFGHVSYERLLSGPGLANIFGFLRDGERQPVPEALAVACSTGDAAAAISAAALAGDAPIAVDALDLFVSVYGAEAGNWALKLKATGGVYVAGGIAPKILPKLQDGVFRKAYLAKGRFSAFLDKIPVLVVLEADVALFGSATYAEHRLGG
jgi:glucokinase